MISENRFDEEHARKQSSPNDLQQVLLLLAELHRIEMKPAATMIDAPRPPQCRIPDTLQESFHYN